MTKIYLSTLLAFGLLSIAQAESPQVNQKPSEKPGCTDGEHVASCTCSDCAPLTTSCSPPSRLKDQDEPMNDAVSERRIERNPRL